MSNQEEQTLESEQTTSDPSAPPEPSGWMTRWAMLVCDLKLITIKQDVTSIRKWKLYPSNLRIYRTGSFLFGFVTAIVVILMLLGELKLPAGIKLGEAVAFCMSLFGNAGFSEVLHRRKVKIAVRESENKSFQEH